MFFVASYFFSPRMGMRKMLYFSATFQLVIWNQCNKGQVKYNIKPIFLLYFLNQSLELENMYRNQLIIFSWEVNALCSTQGWSTNLTELVSFHFTRTVYCRPNEKLCTAWIMNYSFPTTSTVKWCFFNISTYKGLMKDRLLNQYFKIHSI